MSNRKLNQEVVSGLRKSFKVLRAVYPIVKSKRTGEIIDGLHRYEASPITYDKYCVELDMGEKEEILYRLHLNYRRKVTKKEREEQLIKLAEILEKEGVTREEMVSELAKITPFKERWIRELLPEKYKMVEMARESEIAAPPPQKPKVEARVYKPKETWEHRKAVMSPPVSKMEEAVYLALQQDETLRNAGWTFEFQKHYCIKEVVSDVTAKRGAVEKPLFVDGEVHVGREDRDEANRERLAHKLGIPKVFAFSYSGAYSDAKRDEIMAKIVAALHERGLKS